MNLVVFLDISVIVMDQSLTLPELEKTHFLNISNLQLHHPLLRKRPIEVSPLRQFTKLKLSDFAKLQLLMSLFHIH